MLFAIYHNQLEVVKMLLKDFSFNHTIALRLPPPSNETEYIKPQDEKTKLVYYPNDPKIESFGLELAINTKDLDLMSFLWDDMKFIWDPKHFGYLLDYLLDLSWPLGLNWLLGSSTSHLLFESLNPEDKDHFLTSHVFSKKILPAQLE